MAATVLVCLLVPSDAEHVGVGFHGLLTSAIALWLYSNDCRVRCGLSTPVVLGSRGTGIVKECYLVDPASSHMLVSKIKPCMCKYELIQTVKLRMAH